MSDEMGALLLPFLPRRVVGSFQDCEAKEKEWLTDEEQGPEDESVLFYEKWTLTDSTHKKVTGIAIPSTWSKLNY